MKEFLQLLWPSGPSGFLTLWDLHSSRSKHIDDLDLFVEEALALDKGPGQAFFGVASRCLGLPSYEQGKARQLVALPAMFVDVDYGDLGHKSKKLPPDEKTALELLDLFPLKPSVIVNSGFGLHAYYVLEEPLKIVKPEECKRAESTIKDFQHKMIETFSQKGFHLDDVATLPRVLRVPGTHNKKVPGDPRLARVITSSAQRYAFGQFVSKKKESAKPPKEASKIDFSKIREICGRVKSENRDLIDKVLAGESIAPAGDRNRILNKVSATITFAVAKEFPDITPSELAELFRPSLSVWAKEAEASKSEDQEIAVVTDMIRRHLEDVAEKKETQEKEKQELLTLFSKHNKQVVDPPGNRPTVLEKQTIILHSGLYYVFSKNLGEYVGPLNRTDALDTQLLLEYGNDDPLIQLKYVTKKGDLAFKPTTQLCRDYGTNAKNIVYDAQTDKSFFDARSNVLHLACAKKRDLKPTYNAEVEHWLTLLGGAHFEKLFDWLASVTKLDAQCCALYLYGDSGTGKTFLTQGISKIWKADGSATRLDKIVGNFNADLLDCPFVVAHEKLPKDISTGTLRDIIGCTDMSISRKYMPTANFKGTIRLCITANNTELLSMDESLSARDMTAIAERFLFIQPDAKAKTYLASLGRDVTAAWLDDDVLAKHILWLVKNRQVIPGKRFLVEGEETEMHRAIVSQMYVPSLLLEFIAKVITYPTDTHLKQTPCVLVGDGELLVSPNHVEAIWDNFTKRKAPRLNQICAALQIMSKGTRRINNYEYYEMRLDYIYESSKTMLLNHMAKTRIEGPRKYHVPGKAQLSVVPKTIPGTENKS